MIDSPILRGLAEPDRLRIVQVARRRTFGRNEVVFHRGDPADTLHFVVKGRFAVKIVTPLGDTAVLSVASPGDVFGELALLGEDPVRSATVVALVAGETRSLHKLDFDGLRAREPQVATVLVDALASRVRRLSELLVEALYVPAERRVLRRVAELAENWDDGDLVLTQEDLAGLAGTSRATASAERGSPSSSASSPKTSPRVSRPSTTSLPSSWLRRMSTSPLRMMYRAVPTSPSWKMTSPFSKSRRWISAASPSRSAAGTHENIGISIRSCA